MVSVILLKTPWVEWSLRAILEKNSKGTLYKVVRADGKPSAPVTIRHISIPSSQKEIDAAKEKGIDNASLNEYFYRVSKKYTDEIAAALKEKEGNIAFFEVKKLKKKNEIGYDIFIKTEYFQSSEKEDSEHTSDKKKTNPALLPTEHTQKKVAETSKKQMNPASEKVVIDKSHRFPESKQHSKVAVKKSKRLVTVIIVSVFVVVAIIIFVSICAKDNCSDNMTGDFYDDPADYSVSEENIDEENHSDDMQNDETYNHSDSIVITKQPKDITTKANKLITLSVTAKGSKLKYQWYYMKKNAYKWSLWREYSKATITPPANHSWDGMKVRCLITDSDNNKLYSNTVTIKLVAYEPDEFQIYKQPKSYKMKSSEIGTKQITLSVEANGSEMKYQWFFCKADEKVWKEWKGRTANSFKVTPNSTWDGIGIYCRITNSDGEELYSDLSFVTIIF